MKKLFTVLAVLLVATALFAGVTVKAGGTFAFANFKSLAKEGTDYFEEEMKMKASGLGFGVGAQVDIADNFAAYAEFNMAFPSDAKVKFGDSDWVSVKDIFPLPSSATFKYNFFSVSAGVAYKLDFSAVKLAVGGGVTINRSSSKISVEEGSFAFIFTNIGLNALVDAKYMVAENVGVGVTLNPQLGLYSIAKAKATNAGVTMEDKTNGFKVSFAMPITVGVSYTF